MSGDLRIGSPMDERHRSLCLAEARRMLDLASFTESMEAFSWTTRSRQVALLAANWLREEADRLQRRAEVGSVAVLGRTRTRTARIEKFFGDIGREETRMAELRTDLDRQSPTLQERAQRALAARDENLQGLRLALRDFLDAQANRAPYEELAEILRILVEREEIWGRQAKATHYRDMLRTFEARLDNGDFDKTPDDAERERDAKILEFFRVQLNEPPPEPDTSGYEEPED